MPSERSTTPVVVPSGEPGVSERPPTRRARARSWLEGHPRVRVVYRLLIAVVGILIIAIGIILIPLPGPGWPVVFGGLWVLGLEFATARKINGRLKRTVAAAAVRVRHWRDARRARRATRREASPAASS